MNSVNDIVVFTGGFDPVHSGHIACINDARQYGRIVLGLNSDEWLIRKKGKPFMNFSERKSVLEQFKNILAVIGFDDSDDSSCDAISKVLDLFPNSKIIFVNGGDRKSTNTPEFNRFKDNPRVEFKFGVGGENKQNSSRWILSEWKHPTEQRKWGKSMTYHESDNSKIKRIILDPGASISMQYHTQRSEFWFVEYGQGEVFTLRGNNTVSLLHLNKHDHIFVEKYKWHQLKNTGNEPLSIIEIQYGDSCTEDDIFRKEL